MIFNCSKETSFSYKPLLSWVHFTPYNVEQLVRITRWDVLRKQAGINENNYLNNKFWKDYGSNFNTCPFSTGKLTTLLIAFNNNQFTDRGKEELGISLLDIQWELTINQEALIVKLAPYVDFKVLDSFLFKNHFSEQETEGVIYYHLQKNVLENYTPMSPSSFSKNTMREIASIYIDRDKKLLILGHSPTDILPSIKTHQAKTTNKNFDILDWNLLDANFKDHFTLLVSNRKNKLRSHLTPGLNTDTVCKKRFNISYNELKNLHPIPLRVIGLNKSTQTTQIMAVYNTPSQAKRDQKLRKHLVLNSTSFIKTKPILWNELYLTYIDNKLAKNCLIYTFSSPEEGCMETVVRMRDFPFLVVSD